MSDIVFTPKTGDSNSAFTLNLAEDGAGPLYWTSVESVSPSPWQHVARPGHDGVLPKHMGAAADQWIVKGFIRDDGADLFVTEGKTLRDKNSTNTTWTVTLGGTNVGSTAGMALGDIVLTATGPGKRWNFSIAFVDTGG